MKRTSLADKECPLSTTLDIVGEWWTILLLHDLFDGYTRFEQFEANHGISSGILARRLKSLIAAGLVERRPYQERPTRHEYFLTSKGRSLRPVIIALAAWGNARLRPEERSMILVDTQSGTEVEPIVVDRTSGRTLEDPMFQFAAGPAASPQMRARYSPEGDPRHEDDAPLIQG